MKFLTGGIAREPIGRSGEIPEPTVKVWMGEGWDGMMYWSHYASICLFLCPLDYSNGLFYFILRHYNKRGVVMSQKRTMSTQKLVRVSLLSVFAFLLMYAIEFPLPFFPPFLKYDPSEVPALIAAFAWGPWTGVLVEFLKTLLFFLSGKSTSGLVGMAAAFLAGSSFVLVAGTIYERYKTKNGAVLSLLAGSVAMTVVMTCSNYFVLLPLWGVPTNEVLPMITSAIIPFNMVKAIFSSAVTFVIYKRVRVWLEVPVAPLAKKEEEQELGR